ncbi:uncharacterized protein CMC5_078410 [Chondromyces crocatus]|uniref:Uncharacterized protein n=1 Tax=Chondromyces crocatus TaxID=52 RepID=A0A0K1ERX9_CHOCO|nr:uncharacterized protein CMC5_078410 [Chondromyces crocatus]
MPPVGACRSRAWEYLANRGELLPELSPSLRDETAAVLRGLHPVARRVLDRVHGVWYAENLSDAAAVFLTCSVDEETATGGFILLDAAQFPFDRPLKDVEVPALYWRALALDPGAIVGDDDPLRRPRGSDRISALHHAARYLLLHELGHALSLLAGEFILDGERRMQIRGETGFTGFSWRLMTTDATTLPGTRDGATVRAVVPRYGLDPMTWGTLLDTIGADPDPLVPGYALTRPRRTPATLARDVCAGGLALVGAGFVTPTAARYPTEDFAEMFAHAILADEGKLLPEDRILVDLPGCGRRRLPSPYHAASVAPKRAYLEHALGLDGGRWRSARR